MVHIVQVIDPASGTGMGFRVNDSLSETIDSLEPKARAGEGLTGAELRALLADLEGQAGILKRSGPEINEDGEVESAVEGSMLVAPTGNIDDLQAEIEALRLQVSNLEAGRVETDALVASLTEDKATLEALLEKDDEKGDEKGAKDAKAADKSAEKPQTAAEAKAAADKAP